ncbi:MAG: TRAP transporter substrate-binding protein [Gammaproteobacteria bacterium]|nr:TRAP transporter substrate-binding protein [Gammaproteobacteria bacterium]
MNRKFITILYLLSVLVTAVHLSGCQETQKVRTLKIGHTLDTSHPVHQAMMFMNDRLEVISGGQMRLDIYPSGQLGSERELIELLQIGALAMTKVSASPLEGFIPEMKVFSLPYIFADSDHYWRVLTSEVGKQLLRSGEKYRVRGLAYYDAGSRSFYSTRNPVKEPSDLAGMKIRVMNSQTAVAMVKAMGGSPTPVSFGELYTALQQGVVDGAENNPPSFYLSKHYEVARFYTIDEHTSIPDVVLISTHIWNSLSPQEQSWLQLAADESVVRQRQLWKVATEEALQAVKAAGVEIITVDKDQFKDRVTSVYQDSKLGSMQELINNIQRQAQ